MSSGFSHSILLQAFLRLKVFSATMVPLPVVTFLSASPNPFSPTSTVLNLMS